MITANPDEDEEVVSQIKKLDDSLEIKSIDCDYLISGNREEIAVERKEAQDYVSSIKDGRLQDQLYRMSTNYKLSCVIIEGSISYALSHTEMKRQPFLDSLASAFIKRSPEGEQGQPVIFTVETLFDFAYLIHSIHRRLQKGDFERLPAIKGRKSNPEVATKGILRMIPRIGEKRSEKLYNHPEINSFIDLFEVDVEILQDAVGKKTGKKVYEFIHRKWK